MNRKPPQRILIVRTSAMGDAVHTLPAVAMLREALPEAHIGWVIEERWRELLCATGTMLAGDRSAGRPLVDEVHLVNLKAWRRKLASPETWRALGGSVRELRAAQYDVAVDLQGSIRSAVLARLSGARAVCGFGEPRERPAEWLYSRRVLVAGAHVAEQNCAVARALLKDCGVRGADGLTKPPQFPLPVNAADEAWCAASQWSGSTRFAILAPGAGWGAKQWPVERYGELARKLADVGLASLVNFGPGEEQLATAVEQASGGAARRGLYSLGKLMALCQRASVFVGGDTGPLHLAAAMGTPVVALFGPTDPARNGPLGGRSVVLRSDLSETSHKRRAECEAGLLTISVEQAFGAVHELLEL